MILLRRRSQELELMDQPERVSREEMVGALEGLRLVNRLLGGGPLTVRHVIPLLKRARREGSNPVRICDVGTGSGDIPIAIVRAARKLKIPLCVIAVESNWDLAAAAREACENYPEITVLTADAREILRAAIRRKEKRETNEAGYHPALCEPFDIVTACLFTHHFPPEEVAAWLTLMDGAARVGWVVNDLERHVLAFAGICLSGRLLSSNAVFLHDGPLSVKRAYTVDEWKEILIRAGLRRARISRHWAWRIIVKRLKAEAKRM